MNRNNQMTRVLCLLTLLVAMIALFVAGGAISWQLKNNGQNVPANTQIQQWGEQLPGQHPGQGMPPEPPQVTTTPPETTTPAPVTTTQPPLQHDPAVERVECGGRLTVTTPSANVRTDADKDATLVAVINEGESYDVIAQKCSSSGVLWFEIKLGDTTGYVAGSYVRYDGKIIGGKAYLTFDDGPSANTWRILDTLDQYGVKATFFVIYHKNQDDAYRAIVERGHTIALHSYSHNYSKIYTSAQAYFDDLKKLDDHVSSLTGVHSRIIRFPGGTSNAISSKYCKGVMSELSVKAPEKGYHYFDWNVDSGDADDITVPADKLMANMREATGNQRSAIILMHDASAKTTTADALPQIIEYLQSRGYELLPITEDTPPVHHRVYN